MAEEKVVFENSSYGKIVLGDEKRHFITATAIIVKDGKYLIAKRANWEKAFPSRWTVPGGKLSAKEYVFREPDAGTQWYNILEDLVEREVMEEVGLNVKDLDYVTSLSYVRPIDFFPCLIISLYGNYSGGEVKLCPALTEYAWVSLEEAKNYDLIEGIYQELEILDNYLKTGKREKWIKK